MKKQVKAISAATLAAVCLAGTLSGCDSGETVARYTYQEGVHYSNQIDESADGSYDKGLFMLNTVARTMPDPAVIYVDDEDSKYNGKYLLFGTGSTVDYSCYASDDLVNWTFVSQAFVPNSSSWGKDTLWAPEVIYDADTDLYYLFYSASYKDLLSSNGGPAVNSFAACVLNVAVSENPEGPYLEYSEYALRKEAAEKGETVTDQQVKEAVSKPTYDQQALSDALPDDERTNCFIAIDPSPFVDPVTGKKYLYMARDREGAFQHSWIYVVEMEDWATPKYETITRLTSADDAGYERSGNTINEGPQMTYNPNNGKYYLTFSVNDYGNDTYCVGQAVGDSPMGPFRKLKTEEGGLFIYSADNEGVSGAGHHFMLTVNGQLYAVYHRHVDPAEGGANRAATIDSVSWVKNSDGLEVLHLNGCSTTLQLSPVSAYKNIATEAKLSVSEGENASALNDGVIPTHTTIEPWIKEYEMSGDSATITLTFDDYRTVAGIMIYNSTDYDKTFEKISSIRFECKINGERAFADIIDLQFNSDYLENGMTVPAAAAIASFADIEVKSVTITLNRMYADQAMLAIGEICIIGK